MQVMPPDVVQIRDADVDAGVIERAEQAGDDDVEQREEGVRLVAEGLVAELGDPEQGPEVVVLANDVLDWVRVDGVDVAAPGSVLQVVVLVDVGVEEL